MKGAYTTSPVTGPLVDAVHASGTAVMFEYRGAIISTEYSLSDQLRPNGPHFSGRTFSTP